MREEDRLLKGVGRIEFLRTQEVLRRHLPRPPARVLDVGGATGVHASWLADDGYTVQLVDVAPRHVNQARVELSAKDVVVSMGDARALPVPDRSHDAVLLLGPLYHLPERPDRVRAWREAKRVVRSGGVVVGAAISRFASLFDGLVRGFLFDSDFREVVDHDLQHGRHENPECRPHWFTTAYFHHPGELAEEASDAGMRPFELVGLEGLPGWLPDLQERWASKADREIILDAARRVESEPALAGLSAHILQICHAVHP